MDVFDKFKKGMAKTAQFLKTDVRDIFKAEGHLVDQDFLDELFKTLIKMEIGEVAAQEIIDEIAEKFRGRKVQMEEILEPMRKRLGL